MGNITVEQTKYGNWGNVVRVTNGAVELLATIDIGPRIIRFGFVGGENLFFEDTDRSIVQQGDVFDKVGGGAWHIYGGHRLWTSPEETPRTTYPDNEPVQWRAVEGGVVLTPPVERWNRLQKEIEVRMDAATGQVTVMHRITNVGPWAVTFAPWALSVMSAGGKAIIPNIARPTGLLANRVFALWPYSRMNDKRVYWGDRFITLQQDSAMPPFKFGLTNESGWAAYYKNKQLFVKRYRHVVDGSYPDYGVSFEAYTNELMLELETLGELKPVQPGETVNHEETWRLYNGVELSFENEERLEHGLQGLV